MNAKEYARLVAIERAADRRFVRAGYAHRDAQAAVRKAEQELLLDSDRLAAKLATWPRL